MTNSVVNTVGVFQSSRSWSDTISVRLVEKTKRQWSLEFILTRPVSRLDLGADINGRRGSDWRVQTRNISMHSENGRDVLASKNGEGFQRVVFNINPSEIGLPRTYEAFMPFGRKSMLIYTGHFQPWTEYGTRFRTIISVEPRPGRRVTVFDSVERRLVGWESPLNHPAFLLVGPGPTHIGKRRGNKAEPLASDGPRKTFVASIDPDLPSWAKKEINEVAGSALMEFARAFGWSLKVTPNYFVSYSRENRLPNGERAPVQGMVSFNGDALPGQFRVALEGPAWGERTPFTLNVLRTGLLHEAAHLWQSVARPLSYDVPDWIHEGGANVLASELMVRLGYWTLAEAAEDLSLAKKACVNALRGQALNRASARRDVDAAYNCGQVLNNLAAEAHPNGIIGFWNDFIARTEEQGGYDAKLFYRVAGEFGGQQLSAEMERFARTNYARPERGFAILEAAAVVTPYSGRSIDNNLQKAN
ncbi:MAG: hypothetical protein AAF720_04300 [Pseudomonadota bacterium]